jgi:Ni,Fe-hydrogenase I small subunit
MPRFWDQMTPFYGRLPSPPGFPSDVTVDQIGIGLIGAVTAASAAHGVASYVRKRREGRQLPVMAGQTATAPDDPGEKGTDA